jgi:hypothetical protein
MPTTGSPTTEDIGQAEQFAFRVVQSRSTRCRQVYVRSDRNLGTKSTFTPKCERKRRGYLLLKIANPYLSIRQLTQGDTPYLPVALGLCRTANMVFRET